MNYRYSPEGRQGAFQYLPYFFNSADYDVFIWYPSDVNFEQDVTVKLMTSDGEVTEQVDQTKSGGNWIKLGRYHFKKGRHLALVIEAEMDDKVVVADAVKFLLVE
jgi:hypothetical protein